MLGCQPGDVINPATYKESTKIDPVIVILGGHWWHARIIVSFHPRDPVRVLWLPRFHFLLFETLSFLRVTGNPGQICNSTILIVYVCPGDWNKTCPAMKCLLTGFPSTVPVGTEMSGLWCQCWRVYQTRLIWRWKIPSVDGPRYTGLLTTVRYTCRSFLFVAKLHDNSL